MTDMGIYFEPPRRNALRKWKLMQILGEKGYKFQTEGSAFYIKKYVLSENLSVEKLKRHVEFLEKESLERKIKERLSLKKKFWSKQK